MNKIILTGNLTKDPIINNTNSGKALTKFGIAVNRPFSKNNEVDFFNVTAWGSTAEFCCKYLEKGRRVVVEGRLQTSKYTDKDGVEKISYDVIADVIEFADSKRKTAESNSDDDGKPEEISDSDLPF